MKVILVDLVTSHIFSMEMFVSPNNVLNGLVQSFALMHSHLRKRHTMAVESD